MDILAKNTGFRIEKIIFDSTEFQFWGSEQYKRGIPLKGENSYRVNPSKSIFSKGEMRRFKQRAKELNSKNVGDQAAFYLERM